MIGQRMNPVLRKQMSRDALVKKDSKDNIKVRSRSNDSGPRRHSEDLRRKSDIPPPVEAPPSLPTSHSPYERYNATTTATSAILPEAKACNSPLSDDHSTAKPGDVDNDNDSDQDHNEDDPMDHQHHSDGIDLDEDEDSDEDDEEDIIFITSPQDLDDIGKPIEVSANDIGSASSSSSSREEDDDGRKSPSSDNEADDEQHTNSEEEDSEENIDEAMIKAITAREAPRMTTSLSRTTSSTMVSSRKKIDDRIALEYEKLQHEKRQSVTVSIPPSPEGVSHSSDQENQTTTDTSATTALSTTNTNDASSKIAKDTSALRKLHKKLEKSKKRQSFTARFLSSISDKKGQCRESLDNVLNSFKDFNKPNSISNDTTTLTIASPITPTPPSSAPAPPPQLNSITLPKDLPPLPPPDSPKAIHTPPAEEDDSTNMDTILSDLDGAKILLDSVLMAYSTLSSNKSTSAVMVNQIEEKLRGMVDSVHQVLPPQQQQQPQEKPEDPATLAMLDKYSSLLVSIIESKLHTQ